MNIDINKLSGDDLFIYFTQDHPDKEYSSIIALVPYALSHDIKAVNELLLRSVRENKKFVAFYPEFDEHKPNGEYIGDIPDGALYLL
jgi:hypothetical protein